MQLNKLDLLSELWKQRCTAYGFFPKVRLQTFPMVLLWVGVPFTVFVRPKEVTMETSTLLKCKLICDEEFGMFPVPIGDWTPGAITVISPNGIDLSVYDVYWGAGETIK